jgi:hypothetical protein
VRRIRWGLPQTSIPKHPFRDSAVFHAGLAGIVLVVAAFTGGGIVRGVLVAAGYFVLATAYSWWRWHERLRGERSEQS